MTSANNKTQTASFKRPYLWNLESISDNQVLRDPEFGMTKASKKTRYSIRALRYWFGDQLLRRENQFQGRPLSVGEIGVDRGQMLLFSKGVKQHQGAGFLADTWDAMSLRVDEEKLRAIGYSNVWQLDITSDTRRIPGNYDAIVMLHVLEHLPEPEHALSLAKGLLRPGGVIIGGFPGIPHFLQAWHQARRRRTAMEWGHVSSFSSKRVRQMAQELDMTVDCLTGTFLIRSSGSFMENYRWWIRFNLLYGSIMPSYAGELYWVMRK